MWIWALGDVRLATPIRPVPDRLNGLLLVLVTSPRSYGLNIVEANKTLQLIFGFFFLLIYLFAKLLRNSPSCGGSFWTMDAITRALGVRAHVSPEPIPPSPVVEPSHLAVPISPKLLTKIDIIMQVGK